MASYAADLFKREQAAQVILSKAEAIHRLAELRPTGASHLEKLSEMTDALLAIDNGLPFSVRWPLRNLNNGVRGMPVDAETLASQAADVLEVAQRYLESVQADVNTLCRAARKTLGVTLR